LKEKDSEGNFKKLVNAVIENSETKRNIILSAKSEDAIQWIAALWFAFPARFLRNFTFSTYSVDPGRGSVLVGATAAEGSRFDFRSQMAFNHQFYVFNFEEQRISPMEHESVYAEIANTAITYARNNKIEKFDEFLGKYNYPALNRDIGTAWKLFAMQENKDEKPDNQNEALDFMFKYAKQEAIDSFWANPGNLSHEVCMYVLEHNIKDITDLRDLVMKNHDFKQHFELMPLFLEKLDEHGKAEYFWKSVHPFTSQQHKECGKQMLKLYIQVVSNKKELVTLIFFADENSYAEYLPELIKRFEADLNSFEGFEIDKLEKIANIKGKTNLPTKGSKLDIFLLMHKISPKSVPMEETCEKLGRSIKNISEQDIVPIFKMLIGKISTLIDYERIFPLLIEISPAARKKFDEELLSGDPELIKRMVRFIISERQKTDENPNRDKWVGFAVEILQKMQGSNSKAFKSMDKEYLEKKLDGWSELKEIINDKPKSSGIFSGFTNLFKSKK
jgi:hypothetical protein